MNVPVQLLTLIYVAFAGKHFVADFVLQTGAMSRGKQQLHGWLLPLLVHAGCHALFTLGLVLLIKPALWWLAAVDLMVHAIIDRGKVAATRACGLASLSRGWWLAIGSDQGLHQLTHFAFVLALSI